MTQPSLMLGGLLLGAKQLPSLRHLFLQDYKGNDKNPACEHPSYHTIVTRYLPQLEVLDEESLNLRKCMAEAMLDNLAPDQEALKSPPLQNWCEGFDWSLEPVCSVVDHSLGGEAGTLRDILHECACLNREATRALQDFGDLDQI
ncbi:unnamed protein product [Choristocarpus tenellus]